MNQAETMLFRILHVFASFLALQLLWFFFSLGIVTVIPATVAMYAVVLEWSKNGVDIIGVWKTFFQAFKMNFRNTLFLGINVGVIAIIIAVNVSIIPTFNGFIHVLMQVIWLFAVSIFISILIAMLPLTVTSHLKGLKLWKHAWIASITILPDILLIGAIGAIFAIVGLYFPMLIIAVVSLFAFVHINIWQRAVKKLPQDFLDQCLLKYRYR
ncbi:YesL family protein [Gracilibacillus sp. D59]|uniref:YesL family protein n=1 Tax=Gracilibacillus sp. D59 TaxID=3457434 RepID=UPI003FCE4351